MFSDVHCHVLSNYYYDVNGIFNDLNSYNIKRIIVNGFDLNSCIEVLNSVSFDGVYGALGIHPDNICDYNSSNMKFIYDSLKNNKIVAIGEIGLDYFHNKNNKDLQIKMFEEFLDLGEKFNLPVIIHCRDASDDMLRILKRHKNFGVIHCFSGSLELAREYIKLGFKLGIGGVVTFKNARIAEVLKCISVDNILLETDCPYLSPVPVRGMVNEPWNVNFVASFLSEIYGISLNDLSVILENNYNNVFNK